MIDAIQLLASNIVITVPSVCGEIYQLQERASMSDGDWSNSVDVVCPITSIGGSLAVTKVSGVSNSNRFYRLHIIP